MHSAKLDGPAFKFLTINIIIFLPKKNIENSSQKCQCIVVWGFYGAHEILAFDFTNMASSHTFERAKNCR